MSETPKLGVMHRGPAAGSSGRLALADVIVNAGPDTLVHDGQALHVTEVVPVSATAKDEINQ